MNKNVDQELEKAAEMLKEFIDEEKRLRQKQEERLWAKIKMPITFHDILARLTKDELSVIRKNLDIKKLSNLNKQDLARELQKRIPECFQGKLKLFDQSRYDLLKSVVDSNGYLFEFDLNEDQVEYFRGLGIIFSGLYNNRKVLFMPQEIIEAFQAFDGSSFQFLVRRNTEWIKLTHGLLFYYGLLNLNQLQDMVEKHIGEQLDIRHYIYLLCDAIAYYEEIERDAAGFAHYQLLDSEWIKEEREIRSDVDFYPFSKEQLLRAGVPDYVERTPTYQAFVEFIEKKCRTSREQADYIVQDVTEGILNGEELGDLVQFLQHELNIDKLEMVQALVDRLVAHMNQTRQWILKGYTPKELAARTRREVRPLPSGGGNVIDFRSKQKIGRNDPCPCGSGKKFKKCCGS